MISLRSALLLLAALRVAFAAQSLTFVPPSKSPTKSSPNYVGQTNYTLPVPKIVKGIAFDQIHVMLLENTDFSAAIATPAFQQLASQGITYNRWAGVMHPSEPNYVAMAGGDTFGLESDDQVTAPANISTIVDLLEAKGVSWASYQENMPCDNYAGKTFNSPNYITGSGTNAFYQRKHHQLAIFNSTTLNPRRGALLRNMNDFAADLEANALPQFTFITPNIDNDGHDTGVDWASDWLNYFLFPLLKDERFNGERTLILLTFDENDTGPLNNNVATMALGNAVPKMLQGTADDTYYSHYSLLSTPQLNWGLDCLGRQDTNKTMNNVLGFVAEKAGYKNTEIINPPLTNGSILPPGPFNPNPSLQTPWLAPDMKAKCVNPSGKVHWNPNPPVNPDTFTFSQCPQVAISTKASLQWNTSLDAEIIAQQRQFFSPTLVIDPSELKQVASN